MAEEGSYGQAAVRIRIGLLHLLVSPYLTEWFIFEFPFLSKLASVVWLNTESQGIVRYSSLDWPYNWITPGMIRVHRLSATRGRSHCFFLSVKIPGKVNMGTNTEECTEYFGVEGSNTPCKRHLPCPVVWLHRVLACCMGQNVAYPECCAALESSSSYLSLFSLLIDWITAEYGTYIHQPWL